MQKLGAAIGALGNTHFSHSIPVIVAHTNHHEQRVKASARTALNLIKNVHPAAVMEASTKMMANRTVMDIQGSMKMAGHIEPNSPPSMFGGFDRNSDPDGGLGSGRDLGTGNPGLGQRPRHWKS